MALVLAGFVVLNGLAVEGAGAIINWGAKTTLADTVHSINNGKGTQQ
jgi:hypothetical protein